MKCPVETGRVRAHHPPGKSSPWSTGFHAHGRSSRGRRGCPGPKTRGGRLRGRSRGAYVPMAVRQHFLRECMPGRVVSSLWSRTLSSQLFCQREDGTLEFRLIPLSGPQGTSCSFAHAHALLVSVSMATRSFLECSLRRGLHPATVHLLHRPQA